ncbi:MAG: hypothetical protein F4012_08005 [Gemmatimonadales bacterium]|nr:hypothetical protein [Gemmatimonadales bacterium]
MLEKDEKRDSPFGLEEGRILHLHFFDTLAISLADHVTDDEFEIPDGRGASWMVDAVLAIDRLARWLADDWKKTNRWPNLAEIYGAFQLQIPSLRSIQGRRRFNSVRRALRDVAVDLCTIAIALDANRLISADDIERAAASPYWSDELWLDKCAERPLRFHDAVAAGLVVDRIANNLAGRVTEFSERGALAVQLAAFAFDHGCVESAQRELRRAIECILGYGHHKDGYALEVLESLICLAVQDDGEAEAELLELAGAFEQITNYTDGDEFDVRETYYRAVADRFPARAPHCYAELVEGENWYCADVLTTSFARSGAGEPATRAALFETFISPSEVRLLKKMLLESDTIDETVLELVRQKVGQVTGVSAYGLGASTRAAEEPSDQSRIAPVDFPAEAFPPGELQSYLPVATEAGGWQVTKECLSHWLKHWERAGRAEDALGDLETIVAEGSHYSELHYGLDTAFAVSLRHQGRSRAYRWLVRAQIATSGWQRWVASSDDEALARVQWVADHYRADWEQFLRDTSKPRFANAYDNGIVLGLSRLVRFLLEVGEYAQARAFVTEMKTVLLEELREQPIQLPRWVR